MRKALVVGIDYYATLSQLYGCVSDAHAVQTVLERHNDGSINFDVELLSGGRSVSPVGKSILRRKVKELFAGDSEIALFYFAGHGHIESTGGYLCASDSETGDAGLSLDEVLTLANDSRAVNKVIVLDSCYSGVAGSSAIARQTAALSEGLTILTASTAEQYATEANGSGVFTTLFVDALMGAAGNLVGDVTPGSVYAHIDQSLGPWEQRPVFKTNVKSFASLRRVEPPISLADLRHIADLFPTPGFEFRLDPSFEPERARSFDSDIPPPDSVHTQQFAILQRYNRLNLVVPIGAPHMWNAAMGYKSCKLTVLGEHYRRLVRKKRI